MCMGIPKKALEFVLVKEGWNIPKGIISKVDPVYKRRH